VICFNIIPIPTLKFPKLPRRWKFPITILKDLLESRTRVSCPILLIHDFMAVLRWQRLPTNYEAREYSSSPNYLKMLVGLCFDSDNCPPRKTGTSEVILKNTILLTRVTKQLMNSEYRAGHGWVNSVLFQRIVHTKQHIKIIGLLQQRYHDNCYNTSL
jgi:hypothetical protein